MKKVMMTVTFGIFILGALVTSNGKSSFCQAIKDVFHYFPEDTRPAKVKETPTRFEETIKKQIRYPETKPETK